MRKIGEFSKLVGIPSKTLRYYDEIGLFCPEIVDSKNGYRFYQDHQIPILNKILFYKQLGFPLDQIKIILTDGINNETVRGMLRQRRNVIQQLLDEEQRRLMDLEETIEEINQSLNAGEKEKDYFVFIKPLEAIRVVSLSGSAKGISQTGKWLGKSSQKVMRYILNNHCKMSAPGIALYHNFNENEVMLEFAQPFEGELESRGEFVVKILPRIEQAACVYHYGPLNEVDYAHQVLLSYIKENGFEICNSVRDIYLKYIPGGNPKDFITEIQYPIK